MTISHDDLYRKTTGELTRLFNAAKADVARQPVGSEAAHQAWNTVTLLRAELNRRQP